MRLFKRVGDILSANLNDLVDGFENPETMLRQAVREMEDAVESSLDEAAKVIATEKLLGRQLDEARRQRDGWQKRAEESVRRHDDEAARQALRRKAERDKLVVALEDQFAATVETSRRLRRQVEAMRVRLAEARRRSTTLTARRRAAEVRKRWSSELVGFGRSGEAFSRFDHLSERVERAEAESEAWLELTQADFPGEEPGEEIETELDALKRAQAGRC